ncbi:MAG: sulfatase [Opitutales bacterium]
MNVLLIAIDDLNTWLLEDENRYAGKVIAPNIRRLADSGVLFKRAYTPSPVCSPSRTATFSGVAPWNSGHYHNALQVKKSDALNNATALHGLFKKAGYFTGGNGKITHGWDQKEYWDGGLGHTRDPAPPGAPLTKTGRGEQDWGPTHLKESEMRDTQIADMAIKQLQMEHTSPFYITCGLFHPHMPWYVPQKYFDMFPLEEVALPPYLENDLDDVPPSAKLLTKGKSNYVKSVKGAGLYREGIRAYLATTAYADFHVGRVLDALEASPYRDNTIVVLMSDHGWHLGEKDHWQKATLWEEGTHCLLTIRVPGVTAPGGVSQRFVSLQDLYPTLTELAGLDKPDYVDGRSLVPLLKDPSAAWSSTAVSALTNKRKPEYPFLSIRAEGFRYTHYKDGEEELYDYAKDPHGWNNVVGNPEYAETIKKLKALLPAPEDRIQPLPSGLNKK